MPNPPCLYGTKSVLVAHDIDGAQVFRIDDGQFARIDLLPPGWEYPVRDPVEDRALIANVDQAGNLLVRCKDAEGIPRMLLITEQGVKLDYTDVLNALSSQNQGRIFSADFHEVIYSLEERLTIVDITKDYGITSLAAGSGRKVVRLGPDQLLFADDSELRIVNDSITRIRLPRANELFESAPGFRRDLFFATKRMFLWAANESNILWYDIDKSEALNKRSVRAPYMFIEFKDTILSFSNESVVLWDIDARRP